jgi:hypothetical protein
MKALVEIEIPDGYEFVGVRTPKRGELYVMNPGEVNTAAFDWGNSPVIVVRKAWAWPSWLKAVWIAMDRDGVWRAYLTEPRRSDAYASWSGSAQLNLGKGDSLYFDFAPPPCDDWKTSLRKNPNAGVE